MRTQNGFHKALVIAILILVLMLFFVGCCSNCAHISLMMSLQCFYSGTAPYMCVWCTARLKDVLTMEPSRMTLPLSSQAVVVVKGKTGTGRRSANGLES